MPNADLGRMTSLREPIANRRKREGTTFDTNHPLAKTILKGCKQGSPVDCFVISHDFELMGSLDYNQFLDDLDEYDNEEELYLSFIKESLKGKRPGLGDLILTHEQPSQTILNTFRTLKVAHQDYTIIGIDTTAFETGGTLTIDIQVGKDKGIGIFYLLDGDKILPSETPPDGIDPDVWNDQQSDEYKNAIDALTKYWGIFPGNSAQLKYKFDQGQHFKLCATGDQWGGLDTINAFNAKVSIETN